MREAIAPTCTLAPSTAAEVSSDSESSVIATQVEKNEEPEPTEPVDIKILVDPLLITTDATTQTKGCVGCAKLKEEIRQMGNKFLTLKEKYDAVMYRPAKVTTGKFSFC